jgi:hypothetical protein
MSFKDQLRADLAGVFLNPGEFADAVTLQGRPVSAVVSQDAAEALDEWRKRTQEPPGVGVRLLTLSLAADAVDRLYPDDVVPFAGEQWMVLSAAVSAGLLTLHLYRHES